MPGSHVEAADRKKAFAQPVWLCKGFFFSFFPEAHAGISTVSWPV